MESLYFILFLGSIGGLLLGLINPRWVKMQSRAQAFIIFVVLGFISMFLLGNEVQRQERRAAAAAGTDSVTATATDSTTAADALVGKADTQPAEPTLGQFVLRSDSGQVRLSSSRDLWDRPHTVAELPAGSEVELLERVSAKGRSRCRVRTPYAPRVAGWVMCENLQ